MTTMSRARSSPMMIPPNVIPTTSAILDSLSVPLSSSLPTASLVGLGLGLVEVDGVDVFLEADGNTGGDEDSCTSSQSGPCMLSRRVLHLGSI